MPEATFKDYVLDQLKHVSGVSARAMFGGFGIYKNATMFGLIAEDELFLKVDDANRADFEARKCKPFVYHTQGRKPVTMSYWRLPDDVLDDPEALKQWAMKAIDAALKAKKAAPQPRRSSHAGLRPPRRR